MRVFYLKLVTMSKSEAQLRANRKYNQTTAKAKFTQILILRDTHAKLKNLSLKTGLSMQNIIAEALQYYKVNSNDN